MRWRIPPVMLLLGAGLLLLPGVTFADEQWPQWVAFKQRHITEDGRVIDYRDPRRITTSEGQAYALFFALVANDPVAFRSLLAWTERHLAQGDLSLHLPAWLWGEKGALPNQVLDDNPASDADLWLAYTLREAGRLWNQYSYRLLSMQLLNVIAEKEVTDVPGLGASLLPGPDGFVKSSGWYLNPSYVPLPLLAAFATAYPHSVWPRVLRSSRKMLMETSATGFVPDWIGWKAGWHGHPSSGWRGSYNAIRVYLWAAMMHPEQAGRQALLAHFRPMVQVVTRKGLPPQSWDAQAGNVIESDGPVGFSAALVPLLSVMEEHVELARQLARVKGAQPSMTGYYEQVLSLFSLGWVEGRYRFSVDGRLLPRWEDNR